MPLCSGPPVICDLGESRIGNRKHTGDVMPGIYRAPEVILVMEWDEKVDVWVVGVMVSLIFGSSISFTVLGMCQIKHKKSCIAPEKNCRTY
jgi:hypothetical protein